MTLLNMNPRSPIQFSQYIYIYIYQYIQASGIGRDGEASVVYIGNRLVSTADIFF